MKLVKQAAWFGLRTGLVCGAILFSGMSLWADAEPGEGSASHIIGRAWLHMVASTGATLIAANLWRIAARRMRSSRFMPRSMEQTLIYAALTVLVCTVAREAFDVARGQPLFKAPIDYASWLVGLGVWGVWGLYRWKYFGWEEVKK